MTQLFSIHVLHHCLIILIQKRLEDIVLPSLRPSTPGAPGRGDLQPQLDSAMQDVTDMCLLMEETEKQAVRRALVEERGRFCTFIGFLQPVVVRNTR